MFHVFQPVHHREKEKAGSGPIERSSRGKDRCQPPGRCQDLFREVELSCIAKKQVKFPKRILANPFFLLYCADTTISHETYSDHNSPRLVQPRPTGRIALVESLRSKANHDVYFAGRLTRDTGLVSHTLPCASRDSTHS